MAVSRHAQKQMDEHGIPQAAFERVLLTPSRSPDGIVKLSGSDKSAPVGGGQLGARKALARAYHLASIKEGKVEGQQPALVNLTMPSGVMDRWPRMASPQRFPGQRRGPDKIAKPRSGIVEGW